VLFKEASSTRAARWQRWEEAPRGKKLILDGLIMGLTP
jgi:hypothetical protein